jgi:WD40 repeat protein
MPRARQSYSFAFCACLLTAIGSSTAGHLRAQAPEEIIELNTVLESISLSRDSNELAIGETYSHEFRLMPLSQPRVTRAVAVLQHPGWTSRRSRATLSPKGDALAVAWDPVPGLPWQRDSDRSRLELWDPTAARVCAWLGEFDTDVTAMAFAPDGGILASGDDIGMVTLWSMATGDGTPLELLRRIPDHFTPVRSVCFSPSGTQLAWTQADILTKENGEHFKLGGSLWFWDTRRRGKPIKVSIGQELPKPIEIAEERDSPLALAFSRDGKQLATGSDGGRVRFWDALTRREENEVTVKSAWVEALAFSPDGQTVVCGGEGQRVYFLSVRESRITLELDLTPVTRSPIGFVRGILFAHDGSSLVIGWAIYRYGSGAPAPDSKILIYDYVALRKAMK